LKEQMIGVFNPRSYWEERLSSHPDITGVGFLGRSPQFLEQQYRARMHQVDLVLRHYSLGNLAGHSVLDVGAGTGIWMDFWHQHGAGSVAGLDFTVASIERLRTQFPDDLVVHADVSVVPLSLIENMRFDIISAFDVLLHIVDPILFQHAIANLSEHCAPGGLLIISDPIVQGYGYVPRYTYAVHNVVRSVSEYREVLLKHGFVIDSIWPTTVLLNTPLEAPNHLLFWVLSMWWKGTKCWGYSRLFTNLVGPLLIKADQFACRLCSEGKSPTAKLIIARKQG
jgi:2-polyprenyl-3-methyl-5-hydroxy-6-metoxy-1,4-benzoquinol methylase